MMANHNMTPKQFEAETIRWSMKHVPKLGKALHKAVTKHIYEGILLKTPVLTGRARGNWFPSVGAPTEQVGERRFGGTQTGEPVTAAEKSMVKTVTEKLEALPLGETTAYVTNNLDYITRLEQGYSKTKAPAGMVHITLMSLENFKFNPPLVGMV